MLRLREVDVECEVQQRQNDDYRQNHIVGYPFNRS